MIGQEHGERSERGVKRVSQFCKPLWDCLNTSDQSPLSMLEYFIQFMAARNALHLLQFWFSVASFRGATPSLTRPGNSGPLPHGTASHAELDGGNERGSAEACRAGGPESVSVLTETQRDESSPPTVDMQYCEGLRVSDTGGGDGVTGARGMIGAGGDVSVNGCLANNAMAEPYLVTRQSSLFVVSDAIDIYSTYIALNALSSVNIPDDIRRRVEVNICPEDGVVDRNCFNEAQEFVYTTIKWHYYQEFVRNSSHLCKYQLELVSSGQLALLDFLLGGDSLGYFTEFMEAEGALPLLQFWLTAESFHSHLSPATSLSGPSHQHCTSQQHMDDAIAIYERYFSLQATEPLGMGDEVRVEIECRICDEKGPRPDSYIPAQLIAYNNMNERYYPSFLESGPYLKFLDGLLAVVRSTTHGDHHDDGGLKAPTQNSTPQIETLSSFPVYDVDDPESLWRRPPLLMRLGYVDMMGHYYSEIEPFPTKTVRSKDQVRHFRRFKNRQEEEEWDYAVKVSRNIISKVLKRTSRTSLKK